MPRRLFGTNREQMPKVWGEAGVNYVVCGSCKCSAFGLPFDDVRDKAERYGRQILALNAVARLQSLMEQTCKKSNRPCCT